MAKDWKGREDLRLQMLRSKRKWGNNDAEANALGAEIVRRLSKSVNRRPNGRGGFYRLSGHSARQHIELGRRTGATPDGRKAGEEFFANGGVVIQFNVHDVETLRDAQRHPERYENLQVRVCGWNVRWNDIPKVEQDKFILRAERIQ